MSRSTTALPRRRRPRRGARCARGARRPAVVHQVLGVDVIERLDHGPSQLLLDPPALRQAVLDPVDAAVALPRVVVAGIHDDHVSAAPANNPAGRFGMFFWGMVTMTTSLPPRASVTVTAVAPVSAARSASVSGPRVRHGDLVPQRGEATGESAADVARADDADLHVRSLGLRFQKPTFGADPQSSITTNVRTSMLSRGGASLGVSGRSKAPCGVKRARPSSRLSQPLISSTSSTVILGA